MNNSWCMIAGESVSLIENPRPRSMSAMEILQQPAVTVLLLLFAVILPQVQMARSAEAIYQELSPGQELRLFGFRSACAASTLAEAVLISLRQP
jgi:purine-cytosine permease-like protein